MKIRASMTFLSPRLRLSKQLPRVVSDYLLPDEYATITVRKHPGILFGHCVVITGWIVAACLVSVLSDGGAPILGAIWGGFVVLVAWLVVRMAAWLESYFVVTETRLIFITGIRTARVVSVPLREIGVLKGHRSPLGRMIGYGEFVAEPVTPGYVIPTMKYMPYMEQLLAEMRELLHLEESES